jgi:hypothetical protein
MPTQNELFTATPKEENELAQAMVEFSLLDGRVDAVMTTNSQLSSIVIRKCGKDAIITSIGGFQVHYA